MSINRKKTTILSCSSVHLCYFSLGYYSNLTASLLSICHPKYAYNLCKHTHYRITPLLKNVKWSPALSGRLQSPMRPGLNVPFQVYSSPCLLWDYNCAPPHQITLYCVPPLVKLNESLLNLQGPFSYKDPLISLVGRKHASINNLLSLVRFNEVYL